MLEKVVVGLELDSTTGIYEAVRSAKDILAAQYPSVVLTSNNPDVARCRVVVTPNPDEPAVYARAERPTNPEVLESMRSYTVIGWQVVSKRGTGFASLG